MALYMIGFISYGSTLVYYAAIFPRLARNTAHSRQLHDKYEAGEISREKYELEESLEKNRISNISTVCRGSTTIVVFVLLCNQAHSNIGYIVTLCLNLSLLLPLQSNPLVDNYTLVLFV